jgi:hypothetical protein
MSAFMIDRKDYLAFAVQLHRFCNAPIPPHYTLELLRALWWISPMDVTSTWTWRVGRLGRAALAWFLLVLLMSKLIAMPDSPPIGEHH